MTPTVSPASAPAPARVCATCGDANAAVRSSEAIFLFQHHDVKQIRLPFLLARLPTSARVCCACSRFCGSSRNLRGMSPMGQLDCSLSSSKGGGADFTAPPGSALTFQPSCGRVTNLRWHPDVEVGLTVHPVDCGRMSPGCRSSCPAGSSGMLRTPAPSPPSLPQTPAPQQPPSSSSKSSPRAAGGRLGGSPRCVIVMGSQNHHGAAALAW